MTLETLLRQRIAAHGPMSVADYMSECLLHPEFGYYTTSEPFGRAGDFVTAPEISQMFGELIGLALAQAWLDQGAPAPFTLAELGPGRGTLMNDMLRATAQVPGFHAAMQVVLVEASERLRSIQRETLAAYSVQTAPRVDDLPEYPLFGVANEFFDALPVRQFHRTDTGWQERQVGVSENRLQLGLGPETPQPALAYRLNDTRTGDVVEYAPALAPIVTALSARIESQGGAFLVVDYGDWRSLGDTVQAVRAHKHADPMEKPGSADLTAQVDFEAIATAANCAHSRLTTQGIFLERLGITARAQSLAKALSGKTLEEHITAHRRLTHPDEMGNLFKVLGLYPRGKALPPGLNV